METKNTNLKPPKTTINVQQELFCQEYIKDFNASQAAARAGYSENSARTIGNDFMRDPRFRKRVAELLKARRTHYPITVERMQEEVAKIAFANTFDLIKSITKAGKITIKSLEEIPKHLQPAVKSIKSTQHGIEVTFHDKVGALEMLAKHFGFFEQDNKQKTTSGIAVYLPDNGRNTKLTVEQTKEGD